MIEDEELEALREIEEAQKASAIAAWEEECWREREDGEKRAE